MVRGIRHCRECDSRFIASLQLDDFLCKHCNHMAPIGGVENDPTATTTTKQQQQPWQEQYDDKYDDRKVATKNDSQVDTTRHGVPLQLVSPVPAATTLQPTYHRATEVAFDNENEIYSNFLTTVGGCAPFDYKDSHYDQFCTVFQRLVKSTAEAPIGSRARVLSAPFMKEMVAIAQNYNHFEDPEGPCANQLHPRKVTTKCGNYAIVDRDATVRKYGKAGNLQVREDYYERAGLLDQTFRVCVEVDKLCVPSESEMHAVHKRWIHALKTDTDLDPIQRHLFTLIDDHGGDCLHLEKEMRLQGLESGIQLIKHKRSPQEFLALDSGATDDLFQLAGNCANEIVDELADIIKGAADANFNLSLEGVSSWPTSFHGQGACKYSSEIESLKAIVGDKWIDALDKPADGFDTSCFSAKDKAKGRGRSIRLLLELLQRLFGILVFDSNKLIFDNDKIPLHRVLQQLGFRETRSFLGGEIRVYKDMAKRHGILVHGPLCAASNSAQGWSGPRRQGDEFPRARRGLTNGVLVNVSRQLEGRPNLSKHDKKANPLNAMILFLVMDKCFHKDLHVCAAFYRACCSRDDNPTALIENGLGKTEPGVAVSKKVRAEESEKGQARAETVTRPLDATILDRLRCIIVRADPNNVQALSLALSNAITADGANAATVTYRWNEVLDTTTGRCFIPNSPIAAQLAVFRASMMKNSGNRISGSAKKAPTQTQIEVNNELYGALFSRHDSDGSLFWVREKNNAPLPKHRSLPLCGSKEYLFLLESQLEQHEECDYIYPVYEFTTFEGLKERCKKRNRAGNDRCNTADRYLEYCVKKKVSSKAVPGARGQKSAVKVTLNGTVQEVGFILVYIGRKTHEEEEKPAKKSPPMASKKRASAGSAKLLDSFLVQGKKKKL